MTITYDPKHPNYLDEADVRDEMTRVFDVCNGCRICTNLCGSFPTLFEYVERHADHDAGRLTPAQQDQVVDECFRCKRCAIACPYTPDRHELAIDFPRLMLRAEAMRHETKQSSVRSRVTTTVIGRIDLLGRLGSRSVPMTNRVVAAKPGSVVRKVVATLTGVSSVRVLPPYVRQRFSTWFEHRPRVRITRRQARVAVFPTCVVEYHNPAIGQDLVKVYERNGIECSLPSGVGCGAPSLSSGDIDRFATLARKNVKALADCVRKGRDIVVAQPTCGYVIKRDYVGHVGGEDAALVAAHTYDAAEFLMKLHKADGAALDTDFSGRVPATVTYHTPCHLRAQDIGLKSRDLIKLTGTRLQLVQQCSGVGDQWGLRAKNETAAVAVAARLGEEITRAGGDVVVGDCHLANTAIAEQTGAVPMHPLQLMARAYGIAPEEER